MALFQDTERYVQQASTYHKGTIIEGPVLKEWRSSKDIWVEFDSTKIKRKAKADVD